MSKYRLIGYLLAAGMFVAPSIANAEEGHRHADAHEHGHGTFNMAIEGSRVDIELEVPGADIVGFERKPNSDAERAKLKDAKAKLNGALDLFQLSKAAACKIEKSNVAFELGGEDDKERGAKEHDDHAHGDHEKHAGEKHSDDKHEENVGGAGHGEFHATYQLQCAEPSKITGIVFNYFKVFAGAEELDVNIVTAKSQTKFEVSREKPSLDLANLM